MARVDYYAIEEAIADHLRVQEDLQNVNIPPPETEFSFERRPMVLISLDRRDAVEGQPLAAGTRTRYTVRFSLWCYQFALKLKDASEMRDDLIGKVEVALMKNRTLDNSVHYMQLEGGEFESGPAPGIQGFVSAGEIILTAEVTATT